MFNQLNLFNKMKTKHLIIGTFVVAAGLSIAISGCKKKEEDSDTTSASDNEQSEFVSNDALNMADAAANGQSSFKNNPSGGYIDEALGGCATVTKDSATHTITIDFGPSNCLCKDGRNRRGKIIVVNTGLFFIAGSSRTVTFDNYYVNDHHIEGIHTVTYNGLNSSNHPNWTISAQNMKITRPNGNYHSWNSTRNREWAQGDSTLFNWTDDVYLITGSASGTNVNGASFTANITSALRWELSCHWLVSGTIELTPANKPTRTVDFGSGACDNQATVTIGTKTYTITMH